MKLSKMNLKSTICCALLFLNLVDATNRYLRRHGRPPLSGCPIGNRGFVACAPILDPVLCGGICVYDNLCSAQAGPGFTKEDCVSVTDIPKPATGTGPVVLGMPVPGNTDVDDTVVIVDSPPVPEGEPLEEPASGTGPSTIAIGEPNPGTILIGDDGIVPCSLVLSVVCGDYKFENLCLAEAAGYDKEKCSRNTVDQSVSQTNTDTEDAIPVYTPGMATPGKPPVSILSDTEEASSAHPDSPVMILPGSPSVSVISTNEETSSGTNSNASWCPGTGSDVVCNERWDPVFCGPENCMYGNLCLGRGAGFSPTDCGSDR
jgi:hypothetical protein